MYFSRTKYSHKEKYYDNDLTDSEDEGGCQPHGCGHSGPARRRPRYSRPPPPAAAGTELVVAPKEAPPAPAACKYKCCPCHAEAAAKACACHCPAQGVAHSACRPAKPAETKPEEPRIVIDVVDRTGGPMAQTHGSRFPISIKPNATVGDIIAMLTPDPRRHKVVVRWDDGFVDDLETACKVEDLKYYARKLYIVNRKQVRYARSPDM